MKQRHNYVRGLPTPLVLYIILIIVFIIISRTLIVSP